MKEDISVIVEGCYPDTPHQLMYCGKELDIPQNASILFSRSHRARYLLYAKSEDFSEHEIINNPFFEFSPDIDPNKLLKGGWPLNRYIKNFNWLFDAQRSVTTRDGRIYVQALYFQEKWRWYLDAVPTIMKECGEIFDDERKLERLFKNPSRAF